MQSHRSLTRKAPGRSITGAALLSALILALVTACGSGGGQAAVGEAGGGSGGAPSSAPSVAPSSQVPATPPDVPTGNLSCPSQFPSAVTVTQAVQDLISLCATQAGTQWDIINISEDVLDIYPASGTTLSAPLTYDVSSDPFPTLADNIEVQVQNGVVAGSTVPNGATLLAVGAVIAAVGSGNAAPQVYVSVDQEATQKSFAAGVWTNYVVGNDPDADPSSFIKSMADCINSTYNIWQELKDPSANAGHLLLDALDAATSCSDVHDKVKEYLQNQKEQENISQETQLAGDNSDKSEWVTQYERDEAIQHEIATDER
jgi:hypothetical protein